MTRLAFLLLLAQSAWSVPAPDSVWIEGQDEGFVYLEWTLVPDADSYEIYRVVAVTVTAGPDGELEPLPEPRDPSQPGFGR